MSVFLELLDVQCQFYDNSEFQFILSRLPNIWWALTTYVAYTCTVPQKLLRKRARVQVYTCSERGFSLFDDPPTQLHFRGVFQKITDISVKIGNIFGRRGEFESKEHCYGIRYRYLCSKSV